MNPKTALPGKRILFGNFLCIMLLASSCRYERVEDGESVGEGSDSLVQAGLNLYVDSLWNARDTALFRQIGSGGFQRALNGITVVHSPGEMQSHMQVLFTAFPDLRWQAEQRLILHREACILWMAEGTNTGTFAERRPTGKKFKITGISRLYFDKQGKIIRELVYYNELDLLQQLGYTLLPPNLE